MHNYNLQNLSIWIINEMQGQIFDHVQWKTFNVIRSATIDMNSQYINLKAYEAFGKHVWSKLSICIEW
jgi:hypothetical protein